MSIHSIDSANANANHKKTEETRKPSAQGKKAANPGKEANAADKVTLSPKGLELSAHMTKTAEKTRDMITANPGAAARASGISDKGKILSLLAE